MGKYIRGACVDFVAAGLYDTEINKRTIVNGNQNKERWVWSTPNAIFLLLSAFKSLGVDFTATTIILSRVRTSYSS